MRAVRRVIAALIITGVVSCPAVGRSVVAENDFGGGSSFDLESIIVGEPTHVQDVVGPSQPGPVGPSPVGPTIQGPDLVIDKVWMATGCIDTTLPTIPPWPDGFRVDVTYRNAGSLTLTKSWDLKMRLVELNDAGQVYRSGAEMLPGMPHTTGRHFKMSPGLGLKVHVIVTVDAKNEVAELKESNNSITQELTNPCVQSFPGGG